MIAAGGIPKPSFYGFELLHHLGEERLENSANDVLVTKAKDGSLVIAVWNIVNPGSSGAPKTVRLDFKGINTTATATISRLDAQHGDTLALYRKMGSPRYPTQTQIRQLQQESRLPAPEQQRLSNGSITLQLPVNGLAVIQAR